MKPKSSNKITNKVKIKDILNNIKSIHILRRIMRNLPRKNLLGIIKYNKRKKI